MPNAEREKEILKILEKKYNVSVKELADTLYASEPTIRRDLNSLEDRQLVIRTHGRVILNTVSPDANMALSAREHHMFNIKSDLAKQASSLVQDGFVIMLDASTTSAHLIKELERFKDIIIITCGIKTAYMLSQTNIKHICTGGECINKSYSLIGQSAINTIRQYNADICFVSCHGLSPSGMATDTSVSENEVRYELMKQSKIKVMMMDNSKINNGFWHNLCDISEFDHVICNEMLPEKIMPRVKNFILVPQSV